MVRRKGRTKRAVANVTAQPTPQVSQRLWTQYSAGHKPDYGGMFGAAVGSAGRTVQAGAGRMYQTGAGIVKEATKLPAATMQWAGGVIAKPTPAPTTLPPVSTPSKLGDTRALNRSVSNTSVSGNLSVGGKLQKAKRRRKRGKRKKQMGIGAIGMTPGIGGAPAIGAGGEAGFRQAASANYMIYEDERRKRGTKSMKAKRSRK